MRSLVATVALICSFGVAAIEPPNEEELAGSEEAPLDPAKSDDWTGQKVEKARTRKKPEI